MNADLDWLPADHPLREPVAELLAVRTPARVAGTRLRHAQSWLAHLGDMGADPLAPSRELVEEWLPAEPPKLRASCLQSLRSLYRVAMTQGVVAADPTRGIHWHSVTVRAEHRLSDDQVRHLLATTQGAADPPWHLAARRDTVLLLLLAWRMWSTSALSRLTWGDVGDGRLTVDLEAGVAEPMPRCVTTAIAEFRATLRDFGVEPVAADALLPVLGRRIEWSWRAAERPLLANLSVSALHQILKRRTGNAGLRVPAGRLQVAPRIWLHRDGRDLDEVLVHRGSLQAMQTTVPTLPGRGLGAAIPA